MRKLALFGTTIALFSCSSDKLSKLERQVEDLTRKVDSSARVARFGFEERCKKYADEYLRKHMSLGKRYSITNHYSQNLNKCFVEWYVFRPPDNSVASVTVFDILEDRPMANLTTTEEQQVKECSVTTLNGNQEVCHSKEEFEKFAELYMKN